MDTPTRCKRKRETPVSHSGITRTTWQSPAKRRKTGEKIVENDVKSENEVLENLDVFNSESDSMSRTSSLLRRLSLRRSSMKRSPPVFTRHNSLIPIRKPLMNLQGSMRMKLARSVRQSMMKGNQDYSLNLGSTQGQLDYLCFMSALQQKSGSSDVSRKAENLQRKIDHEVKMRDGIAKLLAACRGSNQAIEVAKNLLVSNARLNVFMEDMRQYKDEDTTRLNSGDKKACKGTVTITDLRIPLMWKDSDHFRNKGDPRRYAAFCVIQIGSEIHDTELITDVNRLMTDLSFHNVAIFENVDPDFECRIDIYSHKIETVYNATASTPQKIRRKLNDLSLSVSRRLSGVKDESSFLGNVLIGPKFDCIARGSLKLSDIGGLVGSFNLSLTGVEKTGHNLPLFQHFCCKISARPSCLSPPIHNVIGWLTVKKPVSSIEPRQYWCRLEQKRLIGWKLAEHAEHVNPAFTIPLDKNVKLSSISTTDDGKSRFDVMLTVGTSDAYTLIHDSVIDLTSWHHNLRQLITDISCWQHAYDTSFQFFPNRKLISSTVSLDTLRRSSRRLSVTDTCSTNEGSPLTRILNRLNVDEMSPDVKGKQGRMSPTLSRCSFSSSKRNTRQNAATKKQFETDV